LLRICYGLLLRLASFHNLIAPPGPELEQETSMNYRTRRVGLLTKSGLALLVALVVFPRLASSQETEKPAPKRSTFAYRLAPWDSSQPVPVRLVGRIDRDYGGGYRPRSRGFGYPFHFGGTFGYVYSYNRRFGPSQRSHLYQYKHRPRTNESPGFTHPNFRGFQRYGYGNYYRGYSPYTYGD